MTAKPTFKGKDRRALETGDAPDVDVAVEYWRAMEGALGRGLNEAERYSIVDMIAPHAEAFRKGRMAKVTTQERKATLQALIASADPAGDLERADGWTQAHIETAMVRAARITGARIEPPSAEQIREAASSELAVGRWFPKGGRPGDSSATLARAILWMWNRLHGAAPQALVFDPLVAYHHPPGLPTAKLRASPLVMFAIAAFAAAGAPYASPEAVAKRLRKAAGKV